MGARSRKSPPISASETGFSRNDRTLRRRAYRSRSTSSCAMLPSANEFYARFGLATNAPQALYRPAMYKVRFIGHNTFVTGHPYRYGPGEEL